MTDLAMTYGTAKDLPANGFARAGYTFAGWATSASGNVVYADGASVNNLATTLGAVVTLYARWSYLGDKVQLWEDGPYWATTNIGAENSEDYGLYFWWGDTTGQFRSGYTFGSSFAASNCPTYNKPVDTLLSEGWVVPKAGTSVLAPEHDAAQVQWGGDWRMPTRQEFDDLNSKCTWTWTTRNGVAGYVVAGKGDYDSNSIFLPAASFGSNTELVSGGRSIHYWSSVPSDLIPAGAWNLLGDDLGHKTSDYYDRYYGLPIRPVQDPPHEKVQLWENGPYWATANIGAENSEDPGCYFWWGDTVGYRREDGKWVATDGSSSNFSFSEANAPTYGKDVATLQSEGWITAGGVLAPAHDAALAQWGGDWRMPTDQELSALRNNCDWTWATQNGVDGYIVRGRGTYSSKSIFIPSTGYGLRTSLGRSGSYGIYWSSVPYSDYYNAYELSFNSGNHNTSYYGRHFGMPIRPVQGVPYTIRFVANGGTGTMADLAMTYGTAKNLPANGFTRAG